ncbi:MAG: hypothetical protein NC548_33135 [Lachnospiraceae bacterium]|nr:hypothetical protein [Lachnospiraceae bacterium]
MRRIIVMNKFFKSVTVALSAACLAACFAGCGEGEGNKSGSGKLNGDGTEYQQAFLDPVDQDKYFVGMCALTGDTMGGEAESGSTAEWIAKNNKVLGVKCQRVWMHIPNVIERAANSNELSLKTDMVAKYHRFFEELTENGVERILVMNHQFIYPYDYVKVDEGDRQVVIHPIEEAEFYQDWIELYYEAYKLMATEFPEIKFWEVGNEFDSSPFMRRNDKSAVTEYDMGFIDADLCYAANKALKEVSSDNACVYPGMTGNTRAETTFNYMYQHIEAKRVPTLEEYYLNDPDDYFDIVGVHPYPDDAGYQTTKRKIESFYAIMCEHGDGEKRMFITEHGSSVSDPADFQDVAEMIVDCLKQIKQDFPFVETVFYFRMSDRYEKFAPDNLKENYFGCFYSPNDPVNLGKPKPLAIEFYKFINGENADTAPLYWYYNEQSGN